MTRSAEPMMPQLAPLPHEVIRASAGAGKTFALSNRYLRLMARGATPSSILAITFTRKAAGEILARVLRRLAGGSASADAAAKLTAELGDRALTAAHVRALLGQLCESLPRVAISTIDSFFHRVAGAYRTELGLPPTLALVGEGDALARQVRLDAIDALLADDDLDTLLDLLRRLHHGQAKRSITDALDEIVSGLYEVYRQTDASAWQVLRPPPGELAPGELVDAIAALEAVGPLVEVQKAWASAWGKDLGAAREHDWATFLGKGIAAAVAQGKTRYSNVKRDLPPDVIAAYSRLVDHARATMLGGIAQRTMAMHDLLARYDGHYRRLRHEAGMMLFSDVPALLEQGLPLLHADDDAYARREELYYRLDRRVQHLLLDEFQDTSPPQWHVLEPLAREITAAEGRTFFCVGDLKQAIYGWRGGSAAIFDRVEHDLHLPPGGATQLSESWRSSPKVLDVVNRVFGGIADLPPLAAMQASVAAWASGFRAHTSARPQQPGFVQVLNTRGPRGGDEDDTPDEDGLTGLSPHLSAVADHLCEWRRRYAGRSIGVLVRRNATAAAIIQELTERGVEASGEGGAMLTDDAAVTAVLAALQLADHPGDTTAAYQLLHGPLGPVLQLTSIRGGEMAGVSRAIRRRLIDEGAAAVIADWTRQMAPACSARHVRRLGQLVELVEGLDLSRSLRVRDLIERITTTPVESPSAAAMRVMTVHKAKGLEFDAVVLPELEGRLGEVARLQVWTLRADPTCAPEAVFSRINDKLLPLAGEHEPRVLAAREQERTRRLHDDLCTLYVAMTRARYALHILLPPVRKTEKGLSRRGFEDPSGAAVLRHALLDVTDETVLTDADREVFAHGDADWHAHVPAAEASDAAPPRAPAIRLARGDAASRRSWVAVSPSSLEDEGTVRAARLLQLTEDSALARGSAIHALFERVHWLDEASPDIAADDPHREAFMAMLAHDAVREALSRRGRAGLELWREHTFSLHLDGRLLRGQFDRVEIDRTQGTACILDFKTDRFSDAAVERYRPQMQAYRQALASMLGWPTDRITVTLLFVGEGRVVGL